MRIETMYDSGSEVVHIAFVVLSNGSRFKLVDDGTGFLKVSVQDGVLTSRPLSTQMLRLAQEPSHEKP